MTVSAVFEWNPLPYSCTAQVLLLPGIYLLGRRWAAAVVPRRGLEQNTLGILVAITAWLVVVQIATRVLSSFVTGLWVGAVSTGLSGYILSVMSRRRTPSEESAPNAFDRKIFWSSVAATLPIFITGLGGHFHDELHASGHQATICQLQNDSIPIRNLADPTQLLRYHYGFNVVCAALTGWFRLSVPWAIDVTTALGWALAWLMLCYLGGRLTDASQPLRIVAFVTLYGGGLVWLFARHYVDATWPDLLAGFVSTGTGILVNPPLVSYAFQHPFSLGMPVAVAAVYVNVQSNDTNSRRADALLAVLLTGLSLLQTSLFLSLTSAIAFERILLRRRFGFVVACIFVAVGAVAMGGMFTSAANVRHQSVEFRIWFSAFSPHRVAAWHVLTYGALLPLGIAGLWALAKGRFTIGSQALGGVLVPNFFVYPYTWDIVKFATGAQLFLGVSAGCLLYHGFKSPSKIVRALSSATIPVLTASSLLYLGVVNYSEWVSHDPASFAVSPVSLSRDHADCVAWLRVNVPKTTLIYCRKEVAAGYAQYGGVAATVDYVPHRAQFGLDNAEIETRLRLLADGSTKLADYVRLGITWFVVDDVDVRMRKTIEAWEGVNQVEKKKTLGSVSVYAVREDHGSQP